MPDLSTKYQINALTATRAIAAIMVFIHHFGREVFPFNRIPSVFTSGNLAVGYFFLLSGFVLYITYCNKEYTYSDYLRKRIGRIVPVYELALLATICLAVFNYQYDWHSLQSTKEIVYSFFLVQAYVPSYPLVLNGPGWTISVEIFFYLLFPLFLLIQKKSIRIFAVITLVFWGVSQYFHLKYFPQRHNLPDNIVDTVFFNPIVHVSQFLLGMIGGYFFFRIKDTTRNIRFLPLCLFTLIILLIAYRPENISYHVGLIAPLFLAMIISIAVSNNKTLSFKPLVYLGEISYGIYIFQQPAYSFFEHLNQKYFNAPKVYCFWMTLVLLIAVASLSYHLIELPIRRKIAVIGNKRKSIPPAVSKN